MPSHVGRDLCPERPAEQIQITHHIQNFMPRELIRKTQIRINDFLIVNQNKIIELSAACQPLFIERMISLI